MLARKPPTSLEVVSIACTLNGIHLLESLGDGGDLVRQYERAVAVSQRVRRQDLLTITQEDYPLDDTFLELVEKFLGRPGSIRSMSGTRGGGGKPDGSERTSKGTVTRRGAHL